MLQDKDKPKTLYCPRCKKEVEYVERMSGKTCKECRLVIADETQDISERKEDKANGK